MSEKDDFVSQVRDALKHLYDYRYLDGHPLALLCSPEGSPGARSRAERFNRLLLESIDELNPPDAPSQDTLRIRSYRLLVYRYVEGWTLHDILHELGLSRTQFFREQRKAIALLASVVREKLAQEIAASPVPSPAGQGDELHAEAGRILEQREAVDPAAVIKGALEVVSRLAEQRGVRLDHDLAADLPTIYGNRMLLRQILLQSLSSLISRPGTREVCIRMHTTGRRLVTELTAQAAPPGDGTIQTTGQRELNLEPVQRLVEMADGRWKAGPTTSGRYAVSFDLPLGTTDVLLVIDDNEGLIRAFEGYLTGHNVRVVGATTGEEALQRAREVHPAAITLDILMPNQDGWEILQALKNDPVTQHVPIIVCSALEDLNLAFSLGAAAYLNKPVSRANLLAALDNLSAI